MGGAMLILRLVDGVRIVCGLWAFKIRRRGWIATRRRGGIVCYCIICVSVVRKMVLLQGSGANQQ